MSTNLVNSIRYKKKIDLGRFSLMAWENYLAYSQKYVFSQAIIVSEKYKCNSENKWKLPTHKRKNVF